MTDIEIIMAIFKCTSADAVLHLSRKRAGRPVVESLTERFWKFCTKCEECWAWTGNRNKQGYGQLKACCCGSETTVRAHRLSWMIHFGTIPDGMDVCHTCDTPPCSNPKHLFLGTDLDNALDKVRKGRQMRHERHTSAKLKWDNVHEIRRVYSEGRTTQTVLGQRFGVTQILIGKIVRGEIWRES
jgi:hypothetical protein